MIFLGLDDAAKQREIARYCAERNVRKVVIFSPARFRPAFDLSVPVEHIEWAEIIQYKHYYRLLQEIDGSTLLVVNECLRTQNRNELTYNCLRLFLQQADHQLVFQYLPLIDTWADFAILFDFDTKSRWKREPIGPELLREAKVSVAAPPLELRAIPVEVDAKTRAAYAREKAQLLDEVRGDVTKDPHNIPRNLYLAGGRAKLARVADGRACVGRNNRFKLPGLATYAEATYPSAPYVVVELPHNFIEFASFLALSRQASLDVLVADLPVDRWYFERYEAWLGRLRDAYATLVAT